jgi:hypothetical protein
LYLYLTTTKKKTPILVAALFKAWMCCRPLAGIAVSNPAGGMDICQVEVYATGRSLNQGNPTE